MGNACLRNSRRAASFACRLRKHSGLIVSEWLRIASESLGRSTVRSPMSKRAIGLCLAVFCAACGNKADDTKAAQDAIQQLIAKAAAAVDAADIDLASQVWRTSPEISFIHPGGYAHGWEEVKGFYKFFGSAFS